jgi:hypothetical protein
MIRKVNPRAFWKAKTSKISKAPRKGSSIMDSYWPPPWRFLGL